MLHFLSEPFRQYSEYPIARHRRCTVANRRLRQRNWVTTSPRGGAWTQLSRGEFTLKAMWNTFSVCLACSAERAIEAISLAVLHSIVFHIALRAYETLWSATEVTSVALSAEQERRTENMFHMLLTRGSTSSFSHFREPYSAAFVAPMWFSIVWSLALR